MQRRQIDGLGRIHLAGQIVEGFAQRAEIVGGRDGGQRGLEPGDVGFDRAEVGRSRRGELGRHFIELGLQRRKIGGRRQRRQLAVERRYLSLQAAHIGQRGHFGAERVELALQRREIDAGQRGNAGIGGAQ